jgi:hypothetical protein
MSAKTNQTSDGVRPRDHYMPLQRISRVMSSPLRFRGDTIKPYPHRIAMGRSDTLNPPRFHLADSQSDTLNLPSVKPHRHIPE